MTALQGISSTNHSLPVTQNRISTGLRVDNAKGNSSFWAIATAVRGDVQGFRAISENLALSISSISVARECAETIANLLNRIKQKVIQASGVGVDADKIQADVDQLLAQINSVANAAAFKGTNLIKATPDSENLLASMDRGSGTPTVRTIAANGVDLTTTASGLNIAALDVTAAGALASLEAAIATAADAAAEFRSAQMRLEIQSDFVKALTGALSAGAGSLVDANMDEEAARLGALQVQQQFGVRSLSIANSAPESILALFR